MDLGASISRQYHPRPPTPKHPLVKSLFFAIDPPCPPTSGARQRTYLQLKALRELGETRVVLINRYPVTPQEYQQTAETFGKTLVLTPRPKGVIPPWNLFRWANPPFVDRLAQALDFRPESLLPDQAVVDQAATFADDFRPDYTMTRYYIAARAAQSWRFPASVLDLDDIDTVFVRTALHDPSTELWRRQVLKARLRTLERVFDDDLRRFRALSLSSAADLRHVAGLDTVPLPNIPFTNEGMGRDPLPPARESSEILVVASWGYMPNILGLKRFFEHVWPEVRRRVPKATLNVVGANMREQEKRLWSTIPGVRLTGYTDDLVSHYQRAAFCIAPIYQGGGTKIKVLEALSFARVPVIAAHAHHGYEQHLPSPEALLCAGTDQEMIEQCVMLLNDPDLRDRIAGEGYARVRTHFCYPAVRDRLHAMVSRVLSPGEKNRSPASAPTPENR